MKRQLIYAALLLSFNAHAQLFIDYQGVKPKLEETSKHTPDGFRLLTGQYFGLIEQVGNGTPETISTFGEDFELDEALLMVMPEDWFAYLDESASELPTISWDALGDDWLSVLDRIGKEHGLHFVVDWDQQLIQISKTKGFEKPDYNDPLIVTDPSTGREVFIYTKQNEIQGHLLIDGEYVPIRTK